MKGGLSTGLVSLFVATLALVACSSQGVDQGRPQAEPSPRAAADAFMHRTALMRVQYQSANRPAQLRDHLMAKDYDAVEADLGSAEADFERDPSYEFAFYDVLHALASCDVVSPEMQTALEAWVEARPKSVWSHLILGRYYNYAGCKARGQGWAQDVTDAQWAEMGKYHAMSHAELDKAKEIDPKHLPIYTSLILLGRTDGDSAAMSEAYEAGRKLFPSSFNLPVGYMDGLQPRWEGSYEAMAAFADSLKTHTGENPRFWTLQGAAEADMGEIAFSNGDYRGALTHFKNALKYGDESSWLTGAGDASAYLGDLGSTLEYYRRNRLYEIPLSEREASQERVLTAHCASDQEKCKTDPKDFPWFGEPELSESK